MTDAQPSPRDDMSGGLRAAFRTDGVERCSVLALLEARTGSHLDLHLHADDEAPDPPVRIDDEARALRDPSGRYQVLGEIGRGGVGVVYKGRDQDLGRDVAMKVLRPEFADRPEVLERFVEEAQIGGQLQHPGIVPVYELGLQHGERPYFAMKLIKGETLAALLGRRADPGEDRRRFLGIFEQVCQTLAYAHARRVVHRDLKPANVMLGSFGEVQVVDWGFAKVLPEGGRDAGDARKPVSSIASVIRTVRSDPQTGSHSVVGSLVGTPAYMPPEQALGDVEHMDRRSDVFGLGAILCEILTGQPPYLEADGDLIQQAARADLQGAQARIEQSGADAALVALCKQCLSPARQARPESAKPVADAIARYLSSVEERARQAQIHAAEAKVRARSTILLAAAAVLLLTLGGGGYLYVQQQAQARRDQANQRIAAALNEANVRLGEARAAGIADLGLWTRAVDAATAAEQLSTDVEATGEHRRRVAELVAVVREERAQASAQAARIARDEAMRQRLLAVRIPTDDDVWAERYWRQEVRRRNDGYAAAFLGHLDGRDLTTMTTDAGVSALGGPMAVEFAAALDHWVVGRLYLGKSLESTGEPPPDAETTRRLQAMAMALDPDPWRNRLRRACTQDALDRTALVQLHAEADLHSLPAVSLVLLASSLSGADAKDLASAVYQTACERFPADFGAIFALGLLHEAGKEWQQAAACFRVARALRPEMREARHRLGIALQALGDHAAAERVFRGLAEEEPDDAHWQFHLGYVSQALHRPDDAVAFWRRAIALDPKDAAAHSNLGEALRLQGKLEDAIACLRRAIELDPNQARTNTNLGAALADQGRLDEAIACHHRAIEIDPKLAASHYSLGTALGRQGKLDEAIASYRRAIELDPKLVSAHNNLGNALRLQGKLDEAIAYARRAIAIDPNQAAAHANLGAALVDQGELDEAIACYRRAIAIDPKLAVAHYNLGNALELQGTLDEAIACYRRAVEIDPKFAGAHYNHGVALVQQGKLDDALVSLRHAQSIWSQQDSEAAREWLSNAETLIGQMEREVAWVQESLAVARGERTAANREEFVAAAMLVYRRGEHVLSARTYERAFAAFPELLATYPHRYNAACSAALAGTGKEQGAGSLADEERARLREQACTWLAAEVERWAQELAAGGAKATEARRQLTHAQQDPDFAGVREEQLAAVPTRELERWRMVWQQLATLSAGKVGK